MFRKIGHVMVAMAPEDGTNPGGGNGSANEDDNNNNNNEDNKDNKTDDNPNKFAITPEFWHNQNQETGDNNNNNSDNSGNNNNTDDNNSSAFDEHVKALSFGDLEMSSEDVSSFVQTGDMKGLSSAITKHSQQVYAKVMQDTATLFKQNRATIMEEVRAEISSASGEKDNLTALHSALEVTRNPAVQPVAIAVMKQAMSKKGITQAQGIEAVREFFKAVRTDDGADTDQTPPGSGNFRGNNGDEIDWAKELAG